MQFEYHSNTFSASTVRGLKNKQDEPLPQIFACQLFVNNWYSVSDNWYNEKYNIATSRHINMFLHL